MIQEAVNRYLLKRKQTSLSPKAVLFDMDGVLYDSMRFHARAWYETATHHQLISTPELFYLYEGRTGESTINELYQKTFLRDATDEEKKLEHTYPGYFKREKMVTAFDVKLGKPHPEPYLMGLEKAGVKPYEALVVENAPMGIQAGVAAGIFTIAVNTGPLDDRILLDAGADLLYPDMTALAKDWDNLMNAIKIS